MQRHRLSYIHSPIAVILVLLTTACALSDPPPVVVPTIPLPSLSTTPRATSTLPPSAQPTPEFTPTPMDVFKSTPTILATFTLVVSPSPTNAACSSEEIDQYLNVVLPLADEHTVDSYEAQKLEALTNEPHILNLRQRAIVRLDSIRGIKAPSCLQEAHEQLTGSFELLISTWDLIEAKDYSTAKTTLKQGYELLVAAVATIVIVQQ